MRGFTNSAGFALPEPYSPIKTASANYAITSGDIGKTLIDGYDDRVAVTTMTMSKAVSDAMSVGAEIAIARINSTVGVELKLIGGRILYNGNNAQIGGADKTCKATIASNGDMLAIKKISDGAEGALWLLTGLADEVTEVTA